MRLIPALAAIAALVLPGLAQAMDATPLTGRWVGGYTCAQGKMGLTLELKGEADGSVTGVFAFAPTKGSGPQAATGRYSIKGSVGDSGLFFLLPDAWIEQPEGYEMVGLIGFLMDGMGQIDGFSGQVRSADCGEYRVKRAN